MTRYQRIVREDGEVVLERAKLRLSFWDHFVGLQFARRPGPMTGLLFVTGGDNRTQTAIHMFFVFYNIGVVWVNSAGEVVDTRLARPFRPYYAPRRPAQYFIEAAPDVLERVQVGQRVQFIDLPA
jgi:hypothetical protein